MKKTILIGEDDPDVRGYLEAAARCMGLEAILAQDGEEVLEHLQRNWPVHGVLLDIIMPRRDGLETLREIRRRNCSLPVIIVSDASSTTNVVQAMKLGATDFISKPVNHDELRAAIQKAVNTASESEAPQQRQSGAGSGNKLFFGTSRSMRNVNDILEQVGPSDAPVLIRGETGVGKEVIARELHALSLRSRKSFLKLNCAALPSELVESELFGYERGAFTGALQKKPGMFELADGGTIFLDEIGDMDFKLQAKLLQVLQDHEFQRVGGKDTVRVDVRVMAATHQDLESAIVARQFREDLYYRLNVIAIDVPPLRERNEDVLPMAEFLIQKHCPCSPPSLTPTLKHVLSEYNWPGNVRELENVVRRFLILRDPECIIRELRMKIAATAPKPEVTVSEVGPTDTAPLLARVSTQKLAAERVVILGALNTTHWNRKQAAAILKIDYKALLYKMKKLGIGRVASTADDVCDVEGSLFAFSNPQIGPAKLPGTQHSDD